MAKNEANIKLNKMTEEKDYWYEAALKHREIISEQNEKITKLQEKVAELERDLELASFWQDTYGDIAGGLTTAVNKKIREVQIERDELTRKLTEVDSVMGNALYTAQDRNLKFDTSTKKLIASDDFKSSPLASDVVSLLAPIDIGRREAVKSLRDSHRSKNSSSHFADDLNDIVMCAEVGAVRETLELVGRSLANTQDPAIIAFFIIHECKNNKAGDSFKGPTIETVKRLPLSWIEQNLPNPPKNHNTLRDGLKIRQQEIASGLTHDDFSLGDGNADRKTLYRYGRWYKKLEEISQLNSVLLTIIEGLK